MIIVLSRWTIPQDDAQRIVRDAAPLIKNQGASSVRLGRITTGDNAGQVMIAISYANFETLGKALTAQQTDQRYQELYSAALKAGKLNSRNIIVADEL